jgi:hypothetical protein
VQQNQQQHQILHNSQQHSCIGTESSGVPLTGQGHDTSDNTAAFRVATSLPASQCGSPLSARSSSSVNTLLGEFVGQLQAFAQESHQASSYKAASATALASWQQSVHGKRQAVLSEAGGQLVQAGSSPRAPGANTAGGRMNHPGSAAALRLQVVSAHELEAVHGLLQAGAAAVDLHAMLAEDKEQSSDGITNSRRLKRPRPLLRVVVPDVGAASGAQTHAVVENHPSVPVRPDEGRQAVPDSWVTSNNGDQTAGGVAGCSSSSAADVARSLLPTFDSAAQQAAGQMEEANANSTAAGVCVMPGGQGPDQQGTSLICDEEQLQLAMPHSTSGWSHSSIRQDDCGALCVTQRQTWLLILQILEEQQQRVLQVMASATEAQNAGGESASGAATAVSGLLHVQQQLMQHMEEAKKMLAKAGAPAALVRSTAVASALQQQWSDSGSQMQDVSIAGCIPAAENSQHDQQPGSPRAALISYSSGESRSATGTAPSRNRDRVAGHHGSVCGSRMIPAEDATGTNSPATASRLSDAAAGCGAEFEFSDQQQPVGVVDEQKLRGSCKFDRLQLQGSTQQVTADKGRGPKHEADNDAAHQRQASASRGGSAAPAGNGGEGRAGNSLQSSCAAGMQPASGVGDAQVAAAAAAAVDDTPETTDAGREIARLRGELLRVQLQLQQQTIRAQVAEGLRHQAWQGAMTLQHKSRTAGDVDYEAGDEASRLHCGVHDQTGSHRKADRPVEQVESDEGDCNDGSDAEACVSPAARQKMLPRLIPAGFFSPRVSSQLSGVTSDLDAAAAVDSADASSPCSRDMAPVSSSVADLVGKMRELQSKVMALRFVNGQLQERIQKQDMQIKQQALSHASAAALTHAYSAAEAITNGSRRSLSGQGLWAGQADVAAACSSTGGWSSPASSCSVYSGPTSAASRMATPAWQRLSGSSSPFKMTPRRSPLGAMPLGGGAFGSNPLFAAWSRVGSPNTDDSSQQASPGNPGSSYCTENSERDCAAQAVADCDVGGASDGLQPEISMQSLPSNITPGLDEPAVGPGGNEPVKQQPSRLSACGGSDDAGRSNKHPTGSSNDTVDDNNTASFNDEQAVVEGALLQGDWAGAPSETDTLLGASGEPEASSKPVTVPVAGQQPPSRQLPEQLRKPLQVFQKSNHRSSSATGRTKAPVPSSSSSSSKAPVDGGQGMKLTAATRARQRRYFLVQHHQGGTVIDRLGD